MIPLRPNRIYKLVYSKGVKYNDGDTIYFQTLDKIAAAKHLIKVREHSTGRIIDLIELLAHPWMSLVEDKEPDPGAKRE